VEQIRTEKACREGEQRSLSRPGGGKGLLLRIASLAREKGKKEAGRRLLARTVQEKGRLLVINPMGKVHSLSSRKHGGRLETFSP